ncbi:MAG: BamA/TamA family outer membrane protein, partial [Bacteroidetes bacterium]|nr:BamA/TamA family outer membrane protein [Fibrella sp.]
QNKQLLFFIPFQVFYDHDNYYFNGEIGYYRYSYYFYGVGQRDIPRELYGVNFFETKLNAFRRIATLPTGGKLYAGIRYQYEDFGVTTVVPDGLLTTGTVPGGRGSRRTAGGLGLFYDSRDEVFFPSRGIVADLTYLRNRWTQSGRTDDAPTQYDRYLAEISSYHALAGRKLILALNYVASFTAGTSPFNDLSQLGSSKRMRGFYEGRYRDRNLALLQSEMRFAIYKRLGGVVFGAVGLLGDNRQLLRSNDPKGAYGAGLRFTANRRDHVNIRVDYGVGKQSSGLYLTIGEAF